MHHWILSYYDYIFSNVTELIHLPFKIFLNTNLEVLRNSRYVLGFIIILKYYYDSSWGLIRDFKAGPYQPVIYLLGDLVEPCQTACLSWMWQENGLQKCVEAFREKDPKSKEKSTLLLLSRLRSRNNVFPN